MIDVLLLFFVVVLVTFVFGELFSRIGLPRMIGQILAGLVLGFPFFSGMISAEAILSISLLSQIGIIFLLILTGLEIDLKKIKDSSKDVLLIAFSCVLIPFAFGFAFTLLIGQSLLVAFVVGSALSLTSEATKTIVLIQANVLKTRLGQMMVIAGTADDIFELLFLSLLLVLIGQGTGNGLIVLPFEIIGFFLVVFIALKVLPRIVVLFKQESDESYFTLAVLIGLAIALFSTALALGPIIGALFAGLLLQKAIKSQKAEHTIEKNLRIVTFGLIIPFFYVHIGLNFSMNDFFAFPVMALAVLLIAFFGKMAGALLVKPFSKLNLTQLTLVGWGMNSRGVMELIIIEVARINIPDFPPELYSAIVFMTIVTTLAFPVALQYYLKKYPKIMD